MLGLSASSTEFIKKLDIKHLKWQNFVGMMMDKEELHTAVLIMYHSLFDNPKNAVISWTHYVT